MQRTLPETPYLEFGIQHKYFSLASGILVLKSTFRNPQFQIAGRHQMVENPAELRQKGPSEPILPSLPMGGESGRIQAKGAK